MIDELNEMLTPETLPNYRFDRRAHYEGSIDKTGGNADWDWNLYQDEKGEYVLFEQYGAGCIYNFVQHRYLVSEQPTFKFYFDDDIQPRFEIMPYQFGEKYPFVSPLADKFIGPKPIEPQYSTIRVVRSYVPMPFKKYCKITSDIPLLGNCTGGGGWGHVVYHTYSDNEPVSSFNPDDQRYRLLAQRWSTVGEVPIKGKAKTVNGFTLKKNREITIYKEPGFGAITGIKLQTTDFSKEDLLNLKIKIKWENEESWAVDLPFGAFFFNELGYHKIGYLYAGCDAMGGYYNYFPMPYFENAEIVLCNEGRDIDFLFVQIFNSDTLYKKEECGHFRASAYYPKKHTKGADSIIATLNNTHGHVVGSIITGYGITEGARADCEGDARIHFDGLRTPCIESDGSESYSCYGWGFAVPPQCNPVSGYDGKDLDIHTDWSMTRLLPGDVYPFNRKLHFAIESFGNNDGDMLHSGAVFYYGEAGALEKKIFEFRRGNEELTAYFEGDDDHVPVTLKGDRGEHITLKFETDAKELILRRVSDQVQRGQRADVYLNGIKQESPWYCPDGNSFKRWLEDEYRITVLKKGKQVIEIVIAEAFNQFGIDVWERR